MSMDTSKLISIACKLDVDTTVSLTETKDVILDTDDEETLAMRCPDVELVFGDAASAGSGALYLTTRRVVWVSSQPDGPAFALRYQQVVMHAISRDPSSYARPCIYLQLDEDEDALMRGDGDGEEEGEGEEEEVSAEVRLVPGDGAQVDELFKVLSDCAALNPDEELEGEGDFFFDEAEVLGGLSPEARAALVAERMAGGAMELGEGEEGEGEEGHENGVVAAEDLQRLVGDDPSRFEDDEEADGAEENA